VADTAHCLFCRIVRKELPAREVLRDEHVGAFHDLNPQSPTHVLVIPTEHADHLTDFVAQGNAAGAARLLAAAAEVGALLAPDGYRVVMNEGRAGGQTVPHLHAHVLAGRAMRWPPG